MAGDGDQNRRTDETFYDEDGFDGYEETTVDPGNWLLLATCVFSFGVMLLVVPLMVCITKKKRRKMKEQEQQQIEDYEVYDDPRPKVRPTLWNILRPDAENRRILKLAVPYSLSALSSSALSNTCLIIISQQLGVHTVAAYALVGLLIGLGDGIVLGPVYASTTLCSHAVGAGNHKLAGQYIQLSIILYLLSYIPLGWFWYTYTYEAILWLEWGEVETAQTAQDYARLSIISTIVSGCSNAVWQLLEVTDHAWEGTFVSIVWGVVDLILTGLVVFLVPDVKLRHVGFVYIGTSLFFTFATIAWASHRGWLGPFRDGLLKSPSFLHATVLRNMFKQSVPLSFGSLLSNAEWTVLTIFASHLGPAEVAAWALMGSIWDVFYATTAGINDASEIRVARHLGDGHASMARLSAYKSLAMGMIVAGVISACYFYLQDRIPAWFTADVTLQKMLEELVPFVGVANLTMTFGMQCWSIIGAQGKYKMATWISFIASWGVTMPLGAVFCYVFRIDLQGLTSAVTVGYVATGASLSYMLLSTDWNQVSRKIQKQNQGGDTAEGDGVFKSDKRIKRKISMDPDGTYDEEVDEEIEELYSSLRHKNRPTKHNIRLVTLRAGARSGLVFANVEDRDGTYVLFVHKWSPLWGRVKAWDSVLALDGESVRGVSARGIAQDVANKHWFHRVIAIKSANRDKRQDEDTGDDNDDDDDYVNMADMPVKIMEIAEDGVNDIRNAEDYQQIRKGVSKDEEDEKTMASRLMELIQSRKGAKYQLHDATMF